MSSSGLDWGPFLASWIKKRRVDHEDASAIRKLFEQYFPGIYKWSYTSLSFVMDILQVNIVQQILVLLEGLLPSMQTETEEEKPGKKIPAGIRSRPGVNKI